MEVLQAEKYDLYKYIISEKVYKKQKFSFNILKKGSYYMRNIGKVLYFDKSFKMRNEDVCFQKVLEKTYVGKIEAVI